MIAESISKISNGATSRQSSGHQPLSEYLIDLPPDARRIIREGRYATILSRQSRITFDPLTVKIAWLYLREAMALVPQGATLLTNDVIVRVPNGFEVRDGQSQRFEVPAFLIDRFCVTNLQYAKFVDAGDMTIWIYGLRAFCHTFIDSLIKLNKLAPLAGPMGNRNRERSRTRSPESVGLKPMLMRRGSAKSYPILNSGKELAHGLTKRHPT